MNNKKSRLLRKIAMTKAHSLNDTTTNNVFKTRLNKLDYPKERYDSLNIVDNIFYQRKLHNFSLRSLVKKFKKYLNNTKRTSRHTLKPQILELLDSNPGYFNIAVSNI
jgi:hypothetical protein